MARRVINSSSQWLQIAATIVFAGALSVLMIIGIQRAGALQATSSALQLASELSSRPAIVRAELTLVQRGLETTTFVGDSVRNLTTLRETSDQAFALLQTDLRTAALADDPEISQRLSNAQRSWQSIDHELSELKQPHRAELYADSASGSELTAAGKQMKNTVDELLTEQATNLQRVSDQLGDLSGSLRAAVANGGRNLRSLLLGGSAISVLLLSLMLYYAWRSRQAANAAASAQRQVSNILGTVREGLFLIDRDMRLGETYSESLTELLRLPAPAGLSFEEVLRPLVDDKTLVGAQKFLGLLWKDKVHEELIESVNPLSQIEVSFDSGRGNDVRYMAFSFRRVRGSEAAADYILGAVSDVTDRVLLARELEHLKSDTDSQSALLLQLLRVEPSQLHAFIGSADVAFRKSNAMLTAPGIEQAELTKKLNGVFRELHAVKGEAAALALGSFVERIHSIEDTLSALRSKSPLTGNDFLPVVVKLDDLISHVQTVQSLQERVAALQMARDGAVEDSGEIDGHRDTTVITESILLEPPPASPTAAATPATASSRPAAAAASLPDLLRSLTQEVARAHARPVRLVTKGLEDVPARFTAAVKDICVQMIRNAVAHGIEPGAQRRTHGKSEEGTVIVNFAADHADDYLLTVEDDGRGLNYEQIVDKALRDGLLRPQQAASLDRASVYRLIFQPGFSTAQEVSEHAGRGVGLDAVGALVRDHGGKIGVATAAGQYTRFKVLFPKSAAETTAASSAA